MSSRDDADRDDGEIEHDFVPRVIEDAVPDCPVCGDRADASLSGERYQLETEPNAILRTCYHGETDTVWIHVNKLATDGGRDQCGDEADRDVDRRVEPFDPETDEGRSFLERFGREFPERVRASAEDHAERSESERELVAELYAAEARVLFGEGAVDDAVAFVRRAFDVDQ